jgi:hypothetical protein
MKNLIQKGFSSLTVAAILLSLVAQINPAYAVPPTISTTVNGQALGNQTITETIGNTSIIRIQAAGSFLIPTIEAHLDGNLDGIPDVSVTNQLIQQPNQGSTRVREYSFRPIFPGTIDLIITATVGQESSTQTIRMVGQAQNQPPPPQSLQYSVTVDGTPVNSNSNVRRQVGQTANIVVQVTNPNTPSAIPTLTATLGGNNQNLNSGPSFNGATTTGTYIFRPTFSSPNPEILRFNSSVGGTNPPAPATFSLNLYFDPAPVIQHNQNLNFIVTVDGVDITNTPNPEVARQVGQSANIVVRVSDPEHPNAPPNLQAFFGQNLQAFNVGPSFSGGTTQGTYTFAPALSSPTPQTLTFRATAHQGQSNQQVNTFSLSLRFTQAPQPHAELDFRVTVDGVDITNTPNPVVTRNVGENANIVVQVRDPDHTNSPPGLQAFLGTNPANFNVGPTFSGGTTQATYTFAPALTSSTPEVLTFRATAHQGQTNQKSTDFQVTLRFTTPPAHSNLQFTVLVDGQDISNTQNPTVTRNVGQTANIVVQVSDPDHTGSAPTLSALLAGNPTSLNSGPSFNGGTTQGTYIFAPAIGSPNPETLTFRATAHAGQFNQTITDFNVTLRFQTAGPPPHSNLLFTVLVDGTDISNTQNPEVSREVGQIANIQVSVSDPDHTNSPPALTALLAGNTTNFNTGPSFSGGQTNATYIFAPALNSPNPETLTFRATAHQNATNQTVTDFNITLRFTVSSNPPTFTTVNANGTDITSQNNGTININTNQALSISTIAQNPTGLGRPTIAAQLNNAAQTLVFSTTNLGGTALTTDQNRATLAFGSGFATPGTRTLVFETTNTNGSTLFTINIVVTQPLTGHVNPLQFTVQVDSQAVNSGAEVSREVGQQAQINIQVTDPDHVDGAPTLTYRLNNGGSQTNFNTGPLRNISNGTTSATYIFAPILTNTNPQTLTLEAVSHTRESNEVTAVYTLLLRFTQPTPPPPPTDPPQFTRIVHNGINIFDSSNTATIRTNRNTPITIHAIAQNPTGLGRPTVTGNLGSATVSLQTSILDTNDRTPLQANELRGTLVLGSGMNTSGNFPFTFRTRNNNGQGTPFTVNIIVNDPVQLQVFNTTADPNSQNPLTQNITINAVANRPLPQLRALSTDPDGNTAPQISVTTNIPGSPTLSTSTQGLPGNQIAGILFANNFFIPSPGNFTITFNSTDGAQFDPITQQPIFTRFTVFLNVAPDPGGNNTNNPPEIELREDTNSSQILPSPASFTVTTGTEVRFKVRASDTDASQTLTINSQQALPTGATLTPTTGTSPVLAQFSWTPTPADLGTQTITFSATDSESGTSLAPVSVVITVNPTGTNPPTENEELLSLVFTDDNPVPASLSISTSDLLTILAKLSDLAGPNTAVTFSSSNATAVPVTGFNNTTNTFQQTISTPGTFTLTFRAEDPDANTFDIEVLNLTTTTASAANPPPSGGPGGVPGGDHPSLFPPNPPQSTGGGAQPIRSRIDQLQDDINDIIIEDLPIPENCEFPDIHNYLQTTQQKIIALCSLGIMGGYADGTFKGERAMNRAEFTKILVSFGYDESIINAMSRFIALNMVDFFPDVKYSYWYAKYIGVGLQNNQLHGYPWGIFDPNRQINLAEALKILINVAVTDNNFVAKIFNKNRKYANDPWFTRFDKTAIELGVLKGNADTIIGVTYDPNGSRGIDLSKLLKRVKAAELIYDIIMAVE